jgi:ketosteroid isomerase-like protein
MVRLLTTLLLLTLAPVFGQTADEKDALAAVQKTFDAMKAHDAAGLRAVMLPDARLYAARDDRPPASRTAEEFAGQIETLKGDLLERFTAAPAVTVHGRIAEVWGEYEFVHDGKFSHCGIDSFSLFKTAEGWKIAAIAYTMETTGCGRH